MLRLDVPRRATINESPQLARLVLEAEREKGPVELDCSKTETYGPFGAALLASCFSVRAKLGYTTALIRPTEADVLAELENTGLVAVAEGHTEALEEGMVHAIPNDGTRATSELAKSLLQPLSAAKHDVIGLVEPCLSALLENLYQWSESAVGGFVVVRWIKKGHKAKIAYVDRGVGIPAALRRATSSPWHRSTDVDVIEAAFSDPSVTSRTEGATGQGLKVLRETVLSHRGKLTVVSLGAKVMWSTDKMTKSPSPALRGTAVVMELSG